MTRQKLTPEYSCPACGREYAWHVEAERNEGLKPVLECTSDDCPALDKKLPKLCG